jgi:hypothetical protein
MLISADSVISGTSLLVLITATGWDNISLSWFFVYRTGALVSADTKNVCGIANLFLSYN